MVDLLLLATIPLFFSTLVAPCLPENPAVLHPTATWPMFHHDLHHTGYQLIGAGRITTPQPLWTYQTSGSVFSSPAVADLNNDGLLEIVVGSFDNYVYCLNATGGLLWRYQAGGYIFSSPAIADLNNDGLLEVVVGSDDGYVYCLNATGGLLWRYQTSRRWADSSPAVADVDGDGWLEVVVGSDTGCVYCLDWGDVLPPMVEVWSPTNTTWYPNSTLWLNFTISDEEWVRGYAIYVDGVRETYQLLLPAEQSVTIYEQLMLTEGWHNLTIVAWDPFNNAARVTVWVGVDTQPPTIWISYPANNSFLNTTDVTVEWVGVDAGIGIVNYSLYLDGRYVTTVDNVTTNYTFVGLGEGLHTVSVVAADAFGHANSTAVVFTIDLTPPVVTITYPGEGEVLRASPTLTWIATDNYGVARYEVYVDGKHVATVDNTTTSYPLAELADGTHAAAVRAVDVAGNTATDQVGFTIDTQPPTLRITSPANNTAFNTTTITVTWTGDDNVGVDHYEVYVDGVPVLSTTDTNATLALDEGEHYVNITVAAIDFARYCTSDTIVVLVDTVAPRVEIQPLPSFLNVSRLTVRWVVYDAFFSYAVLLLDGNPYAALTSNQTIAITNLTDGSHDIRIVAYDVAGNADEAIASFTVDTTPPAVIVTYPLNNSVISYTTLTVKWMGDDIASGIAYYLLYLNDTLVANTTNTQYTLTSLGEGTYVLTLIAYDRAGNYARITITFTIVLPSAPSRWLAPFVIAIVAATASVAALAFLIRRRRRSE